MVLFMIWLILSVAVLSSIALILWRKKRIKKNMYSYKETVDEDIEGNMNELSETYCVPDGFRIEQDITYVHADEMIM